MVGDDDRLGAAVGGVAAVLTDHNALDDHRQALGAGQPVDVGPGGAGVADVHHAGRGVGGEAPGVLGELDLVVVGRGRADVVVADVALALGLDLGVDGDAEGGVAGLGGAGGHLQGEAPVLEEVLLEPKWPGLAAPATSSMVRAAWELTTMTVPAFPAARAVASSASGWAASWLPAGSSITGKLMRCPSTVVLRSRWLMSVSIFGRSWMLSRTARVRREGDLVGGRAGDEVVVSLLQLFAGDGFVLKDVYGLVGHFTASWPLLLSG